MGDSSDNETRMSGRANRARTIAIVQSNYLPWRGYFDLIRSADEFIIFDSVQYTRRDWRNRNIIKTPQGPQWITVPVEVKGKYLQAIDETRIAESDWAERHIRSIEVNYKRAATFEQTAPWLFAALREAAREQLLTRANEHLLVAVSRRLGIATPFRHCIELVDRREMAAMDPSARLLALCRAAKAERYLSGPAARDYLDVSAFETAGVEVAWMDYSGYPDYPQLWGAFEPRVSIVDLLLNTGERAHAFLDRGAERASLAAGDVANDRPTG
jgi:hypothetical protein